MTTRRGLLAFAGAFLAAPSLVRTPGLLMPVRPWGEGPPCHIALPRIWVDPERVRFTVDGRIYVRLLDPEETIGWPTQWGMAEEGA